MLVMPAKAGIQ